MARSDLLVSLVRAAASGDQTSVRTTAEALAADERAKNHHVVADRLERALSSVVVSSNSLLAATEKEHKGGRESVLELEPRMRLDQLVLPLPVQEAGRQIVEEHARAGVLRAHGYEPRHRILLSGPPGNGKTSFAEAVAESLALPFFVVRYDALIGSYLGETNARLRKLFDFVRARPCVLFFDEFDSIGKERGDNHETGEIKRVVSFLLLQLDQLPSYVIVVAATNHAELLDRAVWRRFQYRLNFPLPTRASVEILLDRIMEKWPNTPAKALTEMSAELGVAAYSEVVDFCQNVRRRQILGLGAISVDEAIDEEMKIWKSRVQPEVRHEARSEQATSQSKSRTRSRGSSRKAAEPPAS